MTDFINGALLFLIGAGGAMLIHDYRLNRRVSRLMDEIEVIVRRAKP